MTPSVLRSLHRCIAAGIVLCAFQVQSQVVVTDDGNDFSPDPVNIVTGEFVEWIDDGSGPYQIISDTGAWPTFQTSGGIYFTQSGSYSYHDDIADFGTIIVTPNIPPTVDITNPTYNAILTPPATFDFSADASDTDADGLCDVEFYVGTNLVDDIFDSPFSTTVANLGTGTYVLTAIAYDNVGATTTNSITIHVGNLLPIVSNAPRIVARTFRFDVSGLTIGRTNIVEATTNLASAMSWTLLATNVASSSTMSFTNPAGSDRRFFRLVQLP
jgi:plastocyanin